MISLLAKKFIKNRENVTSPAVRQAYGMLCGIVGICINIILFALKFFAGTISGSIAITADAFNNLSDAGASVVTLLGFKLAGKKPDPDHPFGHGRIEYLSGLAVSMVIILMGVELLRDAVDKILHPEAVEFSVLAVVILIVSICGKCYMFLYNRSIGRKIDSTAMQATATDSLSDCAATSAVLLATLVGHWTNLHIDGWCGLIVSGLILFAGYNAARDTLSPLLGQPPEQEFVDEIEKTVMAHGIVSGIHDLVVHDYGPGRVMITLHAEVPADRNIMEIHDEIDIIEQELRSKLGCEATIHMDPIDTNDETTKETRRKVAELVRLIDEQITIHDFRMVSGPTHTNVIFDAVVPFAFRLSDKEVEEKIESAVRTLDGNYFAVVKIDKSYVK
ncbi:MAG: cation diffusion facilitator family transporter [Eubacteriales bacterium]|nr:cation diffusion facilitator family transporter [Eubacteriales bacterium]